MTQSRPQPAPSWESDSFWPISGALAWIVGAALILLIFGALLGRPDVALLGVAPVITCLWALWSRPSGYLVVDVIDPDKGEVGVLEQQVVVLAPPGCTMARLRVGRPEHGAVEVLVDTATQRNLTIAARSVRTGTQQLFRVEYQGCGGGGLTTGPVGGEDPEVIVVLPRSRTIPALPLPTQMRGQTGQRDSRRPGRGGSLRDVRPFQAGDAVRQVDWKMTARRSPKLEQLYVRRTMALSEAAIVLVVDSRDDVGPDPETWSGIRPIRPDDATSLDLAREAALTIAEGYLATGDRVALEDLGVRRRELRPGIGRRQLDRLTHQLALLQPEGDPPRRLRPPRAAPGSLVYLFSTFLDPEAADMARLWTSMGQSVMAIDVLPMVRTRGLDARHWLALRLVRIERKDRLAELAASGIEVLRWADADDTTTRMLLATRRSHRRPGRIR